MMKKQEDDQQFDKLDCAKYVTKCALSRLFDIKDISCRFDNP